MKLPHITLLAATVLLSGTVLAQNTPPTSGTITYETMRRTDLSAMSINVNGQQIRPGGTLPGGRTLDIPETMESVENFRFAGSWAMREPVDRRNMMQIRMGGDGGGGAPQAPSPEMMQRMQQRARRMRFPIEETMHTNLSTGKTYTVSALAIDSTRKEYYQSEQPVSRPADWTVTGKTKKMLGYTCQKVTCTVKEQPCTVWFTTELPFTFSPAPNFTPDKGVVLLIESDDLLYRATKVGAGLVDEASLKPNPAAKPVTKEEMADVRKKAMATFRQQSGIQMQIRE